MYAVVAGEDLHACSLIERAQCIRLREGGSEHIEYTYYVYHLVLSRGTRAAIPRLDYAQGFTQFLNASAK